MLQQGKTVAVYRCCLRSCIVVCASGLVLEIQVATQWHCQGTTGKAIRGTSSCHKVEQAESCHHV